MNPKYRETSGKQAKAAHHRAKTLEMAIAILLLERAKAKRRALKR